MGSRRARQGFEMAKNIRDDFGVAVNEDGNVHIMIDDVLTPLQVYKLQKVLTRALHDSHKKTGKSIDEDFLR